MSKCLVTKLNEVSSNSDLLRIGEMRVHFDKSANPKPSNRGKNIQFTKDTQLEIIGDAYFTDENLSVNLGKKITVTKNFPKSVYVSNADCDVCILDKYSLYIINDWVKNADNDNGNFSFSIEDLKYSVNFYQIYCSSGQVTGDISALKNLTALVNIGLNKTQVEGDISALKNLTVLKGIGLSKTQVTGDISALKNLTALTDINLSSTQVTGDISALKNLTALVNIDLSSTQVTGDISALRNLTELTNIVLLNITGDIANLGNMSKLTAARLFNSTLSGDLATLPPNITFLTLLGQKNTTFSWGSRPSSSKIVAFEGGFTLNNVDKMLQDQAQCQSAITSSSSTWKKTISCVGTRTSASDAAVQILQSKGYTISITPV